MIQGIYDRIFIAAAEKLKKNFDQVTPTEVANLLNVSQQLINNWRTKGVPASKLDNLANTLDVPFEWLKSGSEQSLDMLRANGEPLEIESIDPENKNNQGLINKVIGRLIKFMDSFWGKSEAQSKQQDQLTELENAVMDSVKNSGYTIQRVPRIYGINIDRWAKLSFVVEHEGDTVFLSLIPKSAIPRYPEDTKDFIYVKEKDLKSLGRKLQKRFKTDSVLTQLHLVEKYEKLNEVMKLLRESETKKIEVILEIAKVNDLGEIPINKVKGLIELFK